MITAKIMRFLRNKVFLTLVLLVGVAYCAISLWTEVMLNYYMLLYYIYQLFLPLPMSYPSFLY